MPVRLSQYRVVSPPRHRDAALRATDYLAKLGPAVEGQHGDDHTYKAACALVVDFALPVDAAMGVFRTWNATCQPPWTDGELLEKLRNASRYGRHALGGKLRDVRPSRGVFETPGEALDALRRAVADRAPQDVIGWLLLELDGQLDWKRPPRKRAPDHRKIPRDQRPAALLAAVGAYLTVDDPAAGHELASWIMQQAAREHFACHPPKSAHRTELPFSDRGLDTRCTPDGRDGYARTQPLPTEGGTVPGRRIVSPSAELPEDPEVQYARLETVAQFQASLSPLEQRVFEQPFSDNERDVAPRVGTTGKTVRSTRQRIRKKARDWGNSEGERGGA